MLYLAWLSTISSCATIVNVCNYLRGKFIFAKSATNRRLRRKFNDNRRFADFSTPVNYRLSQSSPNESPSTKTANFSPEKQIIIEIKIHCDGTNWWRTRCCTNESSELISQEENQLAVAANKSFSLLNWVNLRERMPNINLRTSSFFVCCLCRFVIACLKVSWTRGNILEHWSWRLKGFINLWFSVWCQWWLW